MSVPHQQFTRSRLSPGERDELVRVAKLAASLRAHLETSSARIDAVHQRNAPSSVIQSLVSELLTHPDVGFGEEIVVRPEDGLVTRARPDFYFDLGSQRGILAEVERGGTTTNNHDLKDMWKAHISPNTHHLFLIVPQANWNESGTARERPFTRVVQRMGSFFGNERREIDVVSVNIFGYGQLDRPSPAGLQGAPVEV